MPVAGEVVTILGVDIAKLILASALVTLADLVFKNLFSSITTGGEERWPNLFATIKKLGKMAFPTCVGVFLTDTAIAKLHKRLGIGNNINIDHKPFMIYYLISEER